MTLKNKNFLITGGAKRVGRALAISLARAGGNVIIHFNGSADAAVELKSIIMELGVNVEIIQIDFNQPTLTTSLITKAQIFGPLDGLINNASVFEALSPLNTSLSDWNKHINVNLTAPFLLCREFYKQVPANTGGKIINLLDWRALRPGSDHFPYTISKAALVSLTQSLAVAFAPNIQVNGIALGAVLPPSDGSDVSGVLDSVPANRWGSLDDVSNTVLFLLNGPSYITGEIIHVDGGRHLI